MRRRRRGSWSKDRPLRVFETAADFMAAFEKVDHSIQKEMGDSWCGGSLDDARRFMVAGDIASAADAGKFADMINDAVDLAGVRSEWLPDVVGAFPSVPAFLAGDPCSMWARSPVQDERGEITIAVNVCASESVSADELRRRGVCVLAAVLALSRVRSVRLVAYSSQEFAPVAVRLSFPLDISQACAFLSRPVVFRRLFLGFGIAAAKKETGGGTVGWCNWSECMGGNERAEVLRALDVDGGAALVLTPHKLGSWSELSDQDFIKRLNEMIERVKDGAENLEI